MLLSSGDGQWWFNTFFFSVYQVKTEEQIAAEQVWYGSEKVWLVHKDGFSLGKMEFVVLVDA